MKCMPMIFSGRDVWAAMRPMGIDEVLVLRITSGRHTLSSSRKMPNLRSSRSTAASTTKSAAAMSPREVLGLMRPSTSAFCSSVSLPFLMPRS